MNKRRSLTPSLGMSFVNPGAHALRRSGARHTASDRVTFRGENGAAREGWALNLSRGGLRAILDEDTGKLELGQEYAIAVGEASPKRGRIVWLQEEPDGFVVGVEYIGLSGMQVAAPIAPAYPTPPAAPSSAGVDASGENPIAVAPAAPPSVSATSRGAADD